MDLQQLLYDKLKGPKKTQYELRLPNEVAGDSTYTIWCLVLILKAQTPTG